MTWCCITIYGPHFVKVQQDLEDYMWYSWRENVYKSDRPIHRTVTLDDVVGKMRIQAIRITLLRPRQIDQAIISFYCADSRSEEELARDYEVRVSRQYSVVCQEDEVAVPAVEGSIFDADIALELKLGLVPIIRGFKCGKRADPVAATVSTRKALKRTYDQESQHHAQSQKRIHLRMHEEDCVSFQEPYRHNGLATAFITSSENVRVPLRGEIASQNTAIGNHLSIAYHDRRSDRQYSIRATHQQATKIELSERLDDVDIDRLVACASAGADDIELHALIQSLPENPNPNEFQYKMPPNDTR